MAFWNDFTGNHRLIITASQAQPSNPLNASALHQHETQRLRGSTQSSSCPLHNERVNWTESNLQTKLLLRYHKCFADFYHDSRREARNMISSYLADKPKLTNGRLMEGRLHPWNVEVYLYSTSLPWQCLFEGILTNSQSHWSLESPRNPFYQISMRRIICLRIQIESPLRSKNLANCESLVP